MPTGSYERYGLTGNPFRELASENLEDVGLFHVNQEVDQVLQRMREEVYEKENRAVVAVTGPIGAGKTERLLLAQSEARERGAFSVYFDITAKTPWVLRGVAGEFQRSAEAAGIVKTFGAPGWVRSAATLAKREVDDYDPNAVGRILAAALNERAPSFLLLNDFHNLADSREVAQFSRTVQELTDAIRPGVLVMFSCFASYITWLKAHHPALATRINRTLTLGGLTDDEATLVVAKKLLAKRVVEGLDPVYPFDEEAVKGLNQGASGNPRRLLELADLALEYGISHRSYRVDAEIVQLVLAEKAEVTRPAPIPGLARSPPAGSRTSSSGAETAAVAPPPRAPP